MKLWMLAPAAVLVAVAGLSGHAAEPWNGTSTRASANRAPIFPAAHAWVNNLRQDAAAPAPAASPAPAISGHGNIGMGTPSREVLSGEVIGSGAVISHTAWNHEHQYTGYVYGPGSCDHTPPCVDHLWDGYCQRPHRCGGHHRHCHFRGGCGIAMQGCSSCGDNANVACSSGCDSGCGVAMKCHGCKLHAWKHRLKGCGCEPACDTGCDSCATACGHGCKLFSGKHRGWFGSLCSTCDGGMSCGCATPIGDGPKAEDVPTPSADSPMEDAPAADDAKSARRNTINRYLPWSFK